MQEITKLSVAEESLTLSVMDVFLCLQVPRRVCYSDMGHLLGMADWAEMEPWSKCSRVCYLTWGIGVAWRDSNRWVDQIRFSLSKFWSKDTETIASPWRALKWEIIPIWGLRNLLEAMSKLIKKLQTEKSKDRYEQRWKIMRSLKKEMEVGVLQFLPHLQFPGF